MMSSSSSLELQQQQQQEGDNDGSPIDRNTALEEAQSVIESEGYERIQGFNLLGVVANPRSGGFSATHPQSSPIHRRIASLDTPTAVSSPTSAGGGDSTSSLQALEDTLTHVTEQIDALNQVFEQWSLQYLGEFYFSSHDDSALDYVPPSDLIMESQLTQLPQEFIDLDLQSVQDYLESSGMLAHTFHENAERFKKDEGEEEDLEQKQQENDDDKEEQDELQELQQSVPNAFFESHFDLTDPKTFCEVLVLDKKQEEAEAPTIDTVEADSDRPQNNDAQATESSEQLPLCLSVSTFDILRLPPPDSFTRDLDRVEVALLSQVRSKSIQFFHETNRFQQLREGIAALVKDVKQLRDVLQYVQHGSVESWELIPVLQDKRMDLQLLMVVLESAAEVLKTKSSIGGLLSAGDDLGAAAQIQYGRNLLSLQQHDDDEKEEYGGFSFEMSRLVALGTVQDQLDQYQSLVVSNLSEELVNIFLSWKMSPKQSFGTDVAGMSGYTNGGNSSNSLPRTIAETRQRVRDVVQALTMCGSLTKTGQLYETKLNNVIRIAVRTTVEQFAQDVEQPPDRATEQEASNNKESSSSVTVNVTNMSLERFLDCLDLLFEQLLQLLKSAVGVNNFCREEGFTLKDEGLLATAGAASDSSSAGASVPPPPPMASPTTPSTSGRVMTATAEAVSSAADLSSKSISELLRLRKETHSLVSLEEMKRLWDTCLAFTVQLEKASGHKAYGLRSTLLAQAKAFVERKHESNMSALVAALDSERWTKCNVSAERQTSLTRLCSGRAVMLSSSRRSEDYSKGMDAGSKEKMAEAEVEGIRYKVVWSCLLLVEMILGDVASAACFQALATNVVGKVSELLRLFNSRTTQLVLGAGAIQSAARLKSINAKHLSLVTQCLGLVISILPHVRAALMAQLPAKQHTLLVDLDKIKKEYSEHNEKVLNKFVTIIGGIVEHGLAPRIANTDFDARVTSAPLQEGTPLPCCVFVEGVFTNTEKMHKVLNSLLPGEHLQDVFSRIFAYLDQKIPALFVTATVSSSSKPNGASSFRFPSTDEGKRRMLLEVEDMTTKLNQLDGVRPWEFTALTVLEGKLDYVLRPQGSSFAEVAPPEPQIAVGQKESTAVTEDLPTKESKTQKKEESTASEESTTPQEPTATEEVPTVVPSIEDQQTSQPEVNTENAPVNGESNGPGPELEHNHDKEQGSTSETVTADTVDENEASNDEGPHHDAPRGGEGKTATQLDGGEENGESTIAEF